MNRIKAEHAVDYAWKLLSPCSLSTPDTKRGKRFDVIEVQADHVETDKVKKFRALLSSQLSSTYLTMIIMKTIRAELAQIWTRD